jgi:hypothetical protein
MACVLVMLDGTVAHVVDEIVGCRNTEHLITTLLERFPNRTIAIYPDASGSADKTSASASDIALLRQAGFIVNAKSKNPPVKDRVQAVNAKLCNSNGKLGLFVNILNCPILTKGLEQQGYDKTGAPDKSTGLDHALDALGYFIYYSFPLTGKPTAYIH